MLTLTGLGLPGGPTRMAPSAPPVGPITNPPGGSIRSSLRNLFSTTKIGMQQTVMPADGTDPSPGMVATAGNPTNTNYSTMCPDGSVAPPGTACPSTSVAPSSSGAVDPAAYEQASSMQMQPPGSLVTPAGQVVCPDGTMIGPGMTCPVPSTINWWLVGGIALAVGLATKHFLRP